MKIPKPASTEGGKKKDGGKYKMRQTKDVRKERGKNGKEEEKEGNNEKRNEE
jgi:hypothetical protein